MPATRTVTRAVRAAPGARWLLPRPRPRSISATARACQRRQNQQAGSEGGEDAGDRQFCPPTAVDVMAGGEGRGTGFPSPLRRGSGRGSKHSKRGGARSPPPHPLSRKGGVSAAARRGTRRSTRQDLSGDQLEGAPADPLHGRAGGSGWARASHDDILCTAGRGKQDASSSRTPPDAGAGACSSASTSRNHQATGRRGRRLADAAEAAQPSG